MGMWGEESWRSARAPSFPLPVYFALPESRRFTSIGFDEPSETTSKQNVVRQGPVRSAKESVYQNFHRGKRVGRAIRKELVNDFTKGQWGDTFGCRGKVFYVPPS